uniref:Uncharacterized protein n=2 Tax=Caenorhabditis tropicalis TaxID=1561998 RepID=A0A1I7TBU0_9PELO
MAQGNMPNGGFGWAIRTLWLESLICELSGACPESTMTVTTKATIVTTKSTPTKTTPTTSNTKSTTTMTRKISTILSTTVTTPITSTTTTKTPSTTTTTTPTVDTTTVKSKPLIITTFATKKITSKPMRLPTTPEQIHDYGVEGDEEYDEYEEWKRRKEEEDATGYIDFNHDLFVSGDFRSNGKKIKLMIVFVLFFIGFDIINMSSG